MLMILLLSLSFLYYFFFNSDFAFFDYYLFIIVALISYIFLKYSKREKEGIDLSHIMILSFVYFVPRILKLPEMEIWLDEYSQFRSTQAIHESGILEKAFFDSQPPFEYIFTLVSVSLFGFKAWAIKFFPLLWGFFSGLCILKLGRILEVPKRTSLIASCLWLSHPLLVGYHLEGRPYSLGLFTSLLCLVTYMRYRKGPSRVNLYVLFGSNLLALFSLGLQPAVFLFALTPWLLFFLKSKKEKGEFLLCQSLSALASLPLYYFLVTKNGSNHFSKFEQGWASYWQTIMRMKEEVFLLFSQSPFFWLLILALMVWGWRNLRSLNTQASKGEIKEAIQSFLPFVIFLFCYAFIYIFLINWNFHLRYILLLFSLIVLPLLLFLRKGSPGKIPLVLSWLVIVLINVMTVKTALVDRYYFFGRKEWKNTIEFLNKEMRSSDQVALLNFCPERNYIRSKIIAKEFYANDILKRKKLHISNWTQRLRIPIFVEKRFDYCQKIEGRLFVIFEKNVDCDRISSLLKNKERDGVVHENTSFFIQMIPIHKDGNSAFQNYYNEILVEYGAIPDTMTVLESLYFMEKVFGKKTSYKTEEAFLNSINRTRQKEINDLISQLEQNRCHGRDD